MYSKLPSPVLSFTVALSSVALINAEAISATCELWKGERGESGGGFSAKGPMQIHCVHGEWNINNAFHFPPGSFTQLILPEHEEKTASETS